MGFANSKFLDLKPFNEPKLRIYSRIKRLSSTTVLKKDDFVFSFTDILLQVCMIFILKNSDYKNNTIIVIKQKQGHKILCPCFI